jgi:hypothetical protein
MPRPTSKPRARRNFAEGEFLFRVPRSGNILGSGNRPADSAAEVWAGVKDTTSIAMLEQFNTLYAGSIYARFAAARIQEPCSSRFHNSTRPDPSQVTIFSRSARFDRKMKIVPENGSSPRASRTAPM